MDDTSPGQQRPRAYNADETARILGVSRSTVYELAKQRKLKRVAIGGRAVFTAASIDELFAAAVAEAERSS